MIYIDAFVVYQKVDHNLNQYQKTILRIHGVLKWKSENVKGYIAFNYFDAQVGHEVHRSAVLLEIL